MVRISWRSSSPNGKMLVYYLTYTRVDDTKDSKTVKTTKTEVILTRLKLGKTYSFVVRDQFVCLFTHESSSRETLHFETIFLLLDMDSVHDAYYRPLLYSKFVYLYNHNQVAFNRCCKDSRNFSLLLCSLKVTRAVRETLSEWRRWLKFRLL